LGDRLQRQAVDHEQAQESPADASSLVDSKSLHAHLRQTVAEKTIECAVLDRMQSGSSKYRVLAPDEMGGLLPKDLKASLS